MLLATLIPYSRPLRSTRWYKECLKKGEQRGPKWIQVLPVQVRNKRRPPTTAQYTCPTTRKQKSNSRSITKEQRWPSTISCPILMKWTSNISPRGSIWNHKMNFCCNNNFYTGLESRRRQIFRPKISSITVPLVKACGNISRRWSSQGIRLTRSCTGSIRRCGVTRRLL